MVLCSHARERPGEVKVRTMTMAFLVWLAACSNAQTVSVSESYSLLLKDDRQTWCAYSDEANFQAEVTNLKPIESARITYTADLLVELTYQVEAESGDWIVVDKYTPTDVGSVLRRANLLAQDNLQVIQEGVISGGIVGPFRVVSVSTLDGQKAELTNVDFPEVAVKTDLSATPFIQIVSEMRDRSLGKLCKKISPK